MVEAENFEKIKEEYIAEVVDKDGNITVKLGDGTKKKFKVKSLIMKVGHIRSAAHINNPILRELEVASMLTGLPAEVLDDIEKTEYDKIHHAVQGFLV
jgi:hypothetical protein